MTRIIPNLQALPIHFCGPEEMNQSIRQMLRESGRARKPDQVGIVHCSPSKTDSASPGRRGNEWPRGRGRQTEPPQRFRSRAHGNRAFSRSDKSAIVPETKTVLDAAEELGVNIDYDCRAGICGTCKIKLLSGQVRMDSEEALNSADRADGLILACQAHCLDDVTVAI